MADRGSESRPLPTQPTSTSTINTRPRPRPGTSIFVAGGALKPSTLATSGTRINARLLIGAITPTGSGARARARARARTSASSDVGLCVPVMGFWVGWVVGGQGGFGVVE